MLKSFSIYCKYFEFRGEKYEIVEPMVLFVLKLSYLVTPLRQTQKTDARLFSDLDGKIKEGS